VWTSAFMMATSGLGQQGTRGASPRVDAPGRRDRARGVYGKPEGRFNSQMPMSGFPDPSFRLSASLSCTISLQTESIWSKESVV